MQLPFILHGVRSLRHFSSQVCRFRVLAFETSADDTAVAIVDDTKVLSNVIAKQHAE
jgi:hypothetical protein